VAVVNDPGNKRVYLTGLQYGASSVPEPAALALIGIVFLAIRRRRSL